MESLLAAAAKRIPSLEKAAAIRAFTYFNDADSEPIPTMLTTWQWEDMKRFFSKHTLAYR